MLMNRHATVIIQIGFVLPVIFVSSQLFGQQATNHEQLSKIARGFANPITGEKRIDDILPYAITEAKAGNIPAFRKNGIDSIRWLFDEARVLESLGIDRPTPQIQRLARSLGGILTIESINRTIETFGMDDLSPNLKYFFQQAPDVSKPYVASIQHILDALDANEPTSGERWLAEIEFENMTFSEQLVNTLVSDAFASARGRAAERMIVHEFQKVVSSQRREAWKEIRQSLCDQKPSKTAKPTDFAFSIELQNGGEDTRIIVRNASNRERKDVTLIIENRDDVSITGQNIQKWDSMKAYYMQLPVSHRILKTVRLHPRSSEWPHPFA